MPAKQTEQLAACVVDPQNPPPDVNSPPARARLPGDPEKALEKSREEEARSEVDSGEFDSHG
jgi:hypothetical protein